MAWGGERLYFADIAYHKDILPFRPVQIRGESGSVYFMFWKTREAEAYVPELKEVRDDVLEAWKQRQALELARAKAKDLAEAAKKSAKPLKEILEKDSPWSVKETNEFSWMSTGFTPAGMNAPGLSNVEGVVGVSEDFMRSVFALPVGGVGTAENQPQSFVYVVRVTSTAPGEEELRRQFLQSGNSYEIQQIAGVEGQRAVREWFEGLEKSLGVKWEQPRPGS
jgi:hypothetical protein